MRTVLLNWQLSNDFGWGILGLNVFFHWANDPDLLPIMGSPITYDDVKAVDPLRLKVALESIKRSNRLLEESGIGKTGKGRIAGTLIDPLGDQLTNPTAVVGDVCIGRCILTDTRVAGARARLAKYDALLCGSNWNAQLLGSEFDGAIKVIFEGIDPSLFCPGPKSGLLDPNRFYIFSGGKIEYRKAQDLVLLAFREFSRRHDDAVLVTAWHSPWPQSAVGFQGRLRAPVELNAKGTLNLSKWFVDNGIDSSKVIEIAVVPNQLMPMVLREMDIALQPARAEPCTSLPVKEAMACGLPVIVADNTGMKDLIAEGNCLALRSQKPVAPMAAMGTNGWGESDLDEILATMEKLYTDSSLRRRIGTEAATWVASGRTWKQHAMELKAFVLTFAGADGSTPRGSGA